MIPTLFHHRAWWRLAATAGLAMLLSATAVAQAQAPAPARMAGISAICDDCRLEKFSHCGAGKFIEGPAFDKEGTLWMVALNAGEIVKVSPAGQCTVASKVGGGPNGARFDKAGRQLIVTDRDRGLYAFDTGSSEVRVLRNKAGNDALRGLNDLVIDSVGGIFFTEPYGSSALRPNGRVFYLPPGNTPTEQRHLVLIGDNFAFPNGVMLSPDERTLYIGDYGTKRIFSVPLSAPGTPNPAGIPIVFATMTGGVGPDGMAVDVQGNLYVANYRGGEIVVFAADGFPYGSIRLPEGAAAGTTNMAVRDGYLYITESLNNDVWRVKTRIAGQPLVHQR